MSSARCDRVVLVAPAKVNLHLWIGPRRTDGYHDLETLFASIDLVDHVTLERTAAPGLTLEEAGPTATGVAPESNLAIRAARAYLGGIARPDDGWRVSLTKIIPWGAGLGGGSADAAAVLQGLETAYGAPMGPEKLGALARTLGADVPFAFTGGYASGQGIGDVLRPIGGPEDLGLLLVKPDLAVPTAWAYQTLDGLERPDRPETHIESLADSLASGDVVALGRNGTNSFEPVVLGRWPHLSRCREALLDTGALWVRLSGSGSSFFGVFPSKVQAAQARSQLAAQPGWWVHSAAVRSRGVEVIA